MNEIITKSITEFLENKDALGKISKLYGDASYRAYFRASLKSGRTVIIMKMPDGISSASEEITNYQGPKDELPYINISNYLRRHGFPVPEILHYDRKREVLILEDMGNHLLFKEVAEADEKTQSEWYGKAVELLARIKNETTRDDDCVAFKRSFDETLLNWEFDHFVEYLVEARNGKPLPDAVKKEFSEITKKITAEISRMKYVFTHRDYQSRNLMIRDSQLYIIDFQDALMGPELYDMVALTRDSYIELSDGLLHALLEKYSMKRGLDLKAAERDFDLITIQRKMKDAGRFVYIDRVKKNPNYLEHIPRSLKYVKNALERRPEYGRLYEILKPYVKEWSDE